MTTAFTLAVVSLIGLAVIVGAILLIFHFSDK